MPALFKELKTRLRRFQQNQSEVPHSEATSITSPPEGTAKVAFSQASRDVLIFPSTLSESERSVGEEVGQSKLAEPSHNSDINQYTRAESASKDIKIQKGTNYGVQILYEPPAQSPAIVDIVFLHGLTGNAYTTWLHKGTDLHWPSMCLRNDIPDARIISFGYDADVANWWHQASTNRVNNHADDMLGGLIRLRERSETENRKIIFIAHSLGGLVVETAIASSRHSPFSYRKQIEKNTVGIVFMGTPHLGADAAKWATFATSTLKLVKQPNVNIVQVLKADSEMLEVIQKNFRGILLQREEQEPIEISCFYEQLPVTLVGDIVSKHSAILQPYTGIGIHSNHMDMTKFTGPNDPGYQDVLGEILRPVRAIRRAKEKMLSTQAVHELDEILLLARDLFDISQNVLSFRWTDNIQPTPWFYTSPEYLNWRNSKRSEFLWFSGLPGCGKSTISGTLASDLFKDRTHSEHVACHFFRHGLRADVSPVQSALMICFMVAQLLHERYGQTAIHDNAPWLTQTEYAILFKAFTCAKVVDPALKALDVSKEDVDGTVSRAISLLQSHADEDLWKILESLIHANAGHHTFVLVDAIDEILPEHQTRLLKNLRNLWDSTQAKSNPGLKILVTARPYPRIEEQLKGVPYIAPDKEQKECLASLLLGSVNTRQRRVARNEEHTGEWILNHCDYLGWRSHKTSALLWIQGKPGSGKSVLMKHLLRELQEGLCVHGELIASFFYSARDGELETSHQHMLQALLFQLLELKPALYPCFQKTYRRLRAATKDQIVWGYDDLKQVWTAVTGWHQTPQIYLLVDALDESDRNLLSDVLSLLLNHRAASTSVVKIVLASRPIEMIERRLKGTFHLVLENENRRDIATLVDAQLTFLHDDTDALFAWTKKYLNEHAQGVFLWVTLIIRKLKIWVDRGCSEAEIKNEVRSFPLELVDYYTQIVKSLAYDHPNLQEQARKMIDWVTYAERPVTACEFWDIIAIPSNPDHALSAHAFQSLKLRRLQDVKKRTRINCGDLIEIKGHRIRPRSTDESQSRGLDPQDVVQLLHQTVREFLTRPDKIAAPLDTDESRASTTIAVTCVRYIELSLTIDSAQSGVSSWPSDVSDWTADDHLRLTKHLEPRALLPYALRYLSRHLGRIARLENPAWRMMDDYFARIRVAHNSHACLVREWFERLGFCGMPSEWSAKATDFRISNLVAAVDYGDANVVRALIETQPFLDCVDQHTDTTALQAAAALGDRTMVTLLTDHGADTNFWGGRFGTALEAAVSRGHMEIVQTLLQAGADVNIEGGSYGTALQVAASQGHMEIVQTLLQAGADVNIEGGFYGTALKAAAVQGHMEIVQMLLDQGADVHAQSDTSGTALQAAVSQGHMEIVQMLRECGAGVGAQGHTDIVRLLSEYGAE